MNKNNTDSDELHDDFLGFGPFCVMCIADGSWSLGATRKVTDRVAPLGDRVVKKSGWVYERHWVELKDRASDDPHRMVSEDLDQQETNESETGREEINPVCTQEPDTER